MEINKIKELEFDGSNDLGALTALNDYGFKLNPELTDGEVINVRAEEKICPHDLRCFFVRKELAEKKKGKVLSYKDELIGRIPQSLSKYLIKNYSSDGKPFEFNIKKFEFYSKWNEEYKTLDGIINMTLIKKEELKEDDGSTK